MQLGDVMDEIGDCLDQIAGLNVYRWPPGRVTDPAAVVEYPSEINYLEGRGLHRMKLPVVIGLGSRYDRNTRDRLSAYASGSGPHAIAALIDAWAWTSCGTVTALSADIDTVRMGGVDMLAAVITLDITGPK